MDTLSNPADRNFACRPQSDELPRGLRQGAAKCNVGDSQPPSGLEHPERLAQHRILVRGKVHHAVGDHDVNCPVAKRDVLDRALEELDIGEARLRLILPGEIQHLRGHVQPVGHAGRPDATGRQQYVDPST